MARDWSPASERELERQFLELSQGEAGAVEAEAVAYDAGVNRVVVSFGNGCQFAFPPALAQGLGSASTAELPTGRVLPGGETLRWDSLDVDLSVRGLLKFVFGSREWMRELGRAGGRSTSAAKTRAARRNGLKGGRPRMQRKPAVVRETIEPPPEEPRPGKA